MIRRNYQNIPIRMRVLPAEPPVELRDRARLKTHEEWSLYIATRFTLLELHVMLSHRLEKGHLSALSLQAWYWRYRYKVTYSGMSSHAGIHATVLHMRVHQTNRVIWKTHEFRTIRPALPKPIVEQIKQYYGGAQ